MSGFTPAGSNRKPAVIIDSSKTRHALVLTLTIVLLAALALPGSAQADAPQPEIPSDWPRWLQKAMKKESRIKKKFEIRLDDGRITTTMTGKRQEEINRHENLAFASSDIGGKSPVECWFYLEAVDPANAIEQMQRNVINSLAEENETTVRGMRPYFTDSGVHDGVPYLALDYLYTIGEEDNIQIGLSKGRIAPVGDIVVACMHNEPGYRKTFARVFEGLVSEISVETDTPEPYYREIYRISLGDTPVGIAWSEFRKDADGDTSIETGSATIVQVGPETVTVNDSYTVEYSLPDGRLINQADISTTDREVEASLALTYTDAGYWHVEGTFQGKEVSFELDGATEPLSSLGQNQAVARMIAAGDQEKIGFPAWFAEVDPSTFQETVFEIEGRDGDLYTGVLTAGIRMDARVDEQGSVYDASFSLGPNKMTMERVWNEGEIPIPRDDTGQ